MFAQRFSICFQALASPRWPASCLPHILARRRRTIAPLPATTDLCFQFRLETPILREEQPCGGPPSPGVEILSGGHDFPDEMGGEQVRWCQAAPSPPPGQHFLSTARNPTRLCCCKR